MSVYFVAWLRSPELATLVHCWRLHPHGLAVIIDKIHHYYIGRYDRPDGEPLEIAAECLLFLGSPTLPSKATTFNLTKTAINNEKNTLCGGRAP